MNRIRLLVARRATVLWLAAAVCSAGEVEAQEVQHLSVAQPGGLPGTPVMTGITRGTNGLVVTWDGPSGYYRLFQKFGLPGTNWQQVGAPSLTRNATLTPLSSNVFFRVSGPAPHYAGAAVCTECHQNIHDAEVNTRHAGAFTNLLFKARGGQTNPSCLPCHTVGYGLPTGFVNTNATPHLAGVQCENCHGPAANHAAAENDFTVRPRRELAATVCGGCHTGAEHPTFDEWKTSSHSAVVENMNPLDHLTSCGRCHSGTVRVAMLRGVSTPVISTTLTNDANVGITCAVCHDPHQSHAWTNVMTGLVYTNQLRQALSSTNDFFLSTTDTFTNKYNPSINVCAQCHNHGGATWRDTVAAPHHSPQYNMLLGTVGVLPSGVVLTNGINSEPAAHAGTRFLSDDSGRSFIVTNQCVTCHMQTREYQPGPLALAAVTGHSFKVSTFEVCADCHGSGPNASGLAGLVHGFVADRIQQVKASLDNWAATRAPGPLYATYGTRAWEYSSPGDLSPGGVGPDSAGQGLIPDNIKKARFNLYLVLYDGSYGVHNGPLAFTLLNAAQNLVQQELAP